MVLTAYIDDNLDYPQTVSFIRSAPGVSRNDRIHNSNNPDAFKPHLLHIWSNELSEKTSVLIMDPESYNCHSIEWIKVLVKYGRGVRCELSTSMFLLIFATSSLPDDLPPSGLAGGYERQMIVMTWHRL